MRPLRFGNREDIRKSRKQEADQASTSTEKGTWQAKAHPHFPQSTVTCLKSTYSRARLPRSETLKLSSYVALSKLFDLSEAYFLPL